MTTFGNPQTSFGNTEAQPQTGQAQDTMAQARETVSQVQDKARQSAQESGQKLAGQTTEAFDQFRQQDNVARGYVAFWENLPTHYYFFAAAGSVVLSLLLLLAGKPKAAIFVGTWPPTLISGALMAKQLRPSQEV